MTIDNKEVIKRWREAKVIGNIATIACLIMYASYIDQIVLNFTGHPVSTLAANLRRHQRLPVGCLWLA